MTIRGRLHFEISASAATGGGFIDHEEETCIPRNMLYRENLQEFVQDLLKKINPEINAYRQLVQIQENLRQLNPEMIRWIASDRKEEILFDLRKIEDTVVLILSECPEEVLRFPSFKEIASPELVDRLLGRSLRILEAYKHPMRSPKQLERIGTAIIQELKCIGSDNPEFLRGIIKDASNRDRTLENIVIQLLKKESPDYSSILQVIELIANEATKEFLLQRLNEQKCEELVERSFVAAGLETIE